MKKEFIGFVIVVVMLWMCYAGIVVANLALNKQDKQCTLDSLHYERVEALQDSILNYTKLIYFDVKGVK